MRKTQPKSIPLPFDAHEREIEKCFAKVWRTLNHDLDDPIESTEIALRLFQNFTRQIKSQMPIQSSADHRRMKRDFKLLRDYQAAPRGQRLGVLTDFEQRHRGRKGESMKEGTAKKIIQRFRRRLGKALENSKG